MPELKSLNVRIRIHHEGPNELQGVLHERVDTTAILPQYFIVFDDGRVRDLCDDNFSVVNDS